MGQTVATLTGSDVLLNKYTDKAAQIALAATTQAILNAQAVREVEKTLTAKIEMLAGNITLEVSGGLGNTASIKLDVNGTVYDEELDLAAVRQAFADDPSTVTISAGTIVFNSGTIVINSNNFQVDSEGQIVATAGTIGAINLSDTGIYSNNADVLRSFAGWYRPGNISQDTVCLFAGATSQTGEDSNFSVTYGGKLIATDAAISGEITSVDGNYKMQMANGDITLYYKGVACGTLGTKHFSTNHLGLILTAEEGGTSIMFRHADSSYGTGYCVDYYLNAGWSDNSEYIHVFQSTALFLAKTEIRTLYSRGIYLLENAFIKSYDGDGNVLEEMLGYGDGYVNVGSVGCPTMLRGTTVYLKNTSTTVTSDRNAKNSIEELPATYEAFVDGLQPVRFKYNEGTSDRYHVGYIAQDVAGALEGAGLTTQDFAGYVKMQGNGELGLAYDEFVALLHMKIKRLEQRLEALQAAQ
jgi:hypothetical protein